MLPNRFLILAGVVCSTFSDVQPWGICPEIGHKSVNLDLQKATGNWYLYAWIPNQWSICHNYTLFQDENGNFYLEENYLSAFIRKPSSNSYSVEFNVGSNELKLTSKIMYIIPETTTWSVIDVDYNDFLLLYKCNMISEVSQLWVRNPELNIDLENTPEVMAEAMEKINLTPSDYNLKRNFHCL